MLKHATVCTKCNGKGCSNCMELGMFNKTIYHVVPYTHMYSGICIRKDGSVRGIGYYDKDWTIHSYRYALIYSAHMSVNYRNTRLYGTNPLRDIFKNCSKLQLPRKIDVDIDLQQIAKNLNQEYYEVGSTVWQIGRARPEVTYVKCEVCKNGYDSAGYICQNCNGHTTVRRYYRKFDDPEPMTVEYVTLEWRHGIGYTLTSYFSKSLNDENVGIFKTYEEALAETKLLERQYNKIIAGDSQKLQTE